MCKWAVRSPFAQIIETSVKAISSTFKSEFHIIFRLLYVISWWKANLFQNIKKCEGIFSSKKLHSSKIRLWPRKLCATALMKPRHFVSRFEEYFLLVNFLCNWSPIWSEFSFRRYNFACCWPMWRRNRHMVPRFVRFREAGTLETAVGPSRRTGYPSQIPQKRGNFSFGCANR